MLFFKRAPCFLLNDICHKNICSPWNKVKILKVKGLGWNEKHFNLCMLMFCLVRADVLGTVSKIHHLSTERNSSMQYRISCPGPKRETGALKTWTTAFMRNCGMIFNFNISYYIYNFLVYEFGSIKVQISSILSEGCQTSWTNSKNLNFCCDRCESVKHMQGGREGRKT